VSRNKLEVGVRYSLPSGSYLNETSLSPNNLCPKFERCNAAYCPITGGKSLKGDPTCSYLRESVKPGGAERVKAALSNKLAEAVLADAAAILASTGSLKIALQRAAIRGSRMESMKRASLMRESTRGDRATAHVPIREATA
jgi:hypothetical protein